MSHVYKHKSKEFLRTDKRPIDTLEDLALDGDDMADYLSDEEVREELARLSVDTSALRSEISQILRSHRLAKLRPQDSRKPSSTGGGGYRLVPEPSHIGHTVKPWSLDNNGQENLALKPRICIFGVGGAGGNAVNNMIKSNLKGVDFIVGNTDAQALKDNLCDNRLQLGKSITRGLGAGSKPDVGRASAEEQIDEIVRHLEGANMVFITAGMGGGTGTGAAPVIARAARERGILTIGVVTKPFHFEGSHRMRLAESGIAELQQYVDTLIIIPNQNLFRIANEKTTFADAFKMADDVLHSGVRGVTDLMVMPGLINLDFADIRSVMTEMGKAMMGTGEAIGERRAVEAAEAAISNPLLDDVSMQGARGVLINITGGYDMTLFEVDEAANRIRDEVDPDANIIFGSTFDSSMEGRMRISVVATGIDAAALAHPRTGVQQSVNLPVASDCSSKPVTRSLCDLAGDAMSSSAVNPGKPTHDIFIPPKAADPAPHPPAADPVVMSPSTNRLDSHAKKRMSLFELVTGLRRNQKNDPGESASKYSASVPEEDVLDIPAFLRRQSE